MLLRSRYLLLAVGLSPFGLAAAGCDEETVPKDPDPEQPLECDVASLAFAMGDPTGHADPFGAKAAGQARAGRINAADVPQPAHGKFKIEDGDFVLANEHVAIVIENADVSDGYARFGGEILAVDRVGDDGRPLGESMFVETLQLTSLYNVKPDSITVMNDGSDGNAAVIRVAGILTPIPFLGDTFGAIFPKDYADLPSVVDYVLEPGAEKLSIQYGIANPNIDYNVDTGATIEGSWELLGFFQTTFNKRFVPGTGFGEPKGKGALVGFVADRGVPFAYQGPDGGQIEYGGISQSGFELFGGDGVVYPACTSSVSERFELVVGEVGRGVDGLLEVTRRANGAAAWREVTGQLTDDAGQPVAGAFVHVTGASGYITRALTDASGNYSLHVPDETVTFTPKLRGYPTQGTEVAPGTTTQDLSFAPHATIRVAAVVANTTTPLPVRVQVIPTSAPAPTPDAFGTPDEANGRLLVDFAVNGQSTLVVPPGEHRVVVSRGYEWEIHDEVVTVAAGETLDVAAPLEHSVDTIGAMSADFHIHSQYSADSSDPVEYKVRGALAEGLDIPVSSEHEWVISFQPIIEQLGMEDWAFGISSEELTTFTWGHFGVVPLTPRPGELNNGARDWLGKTPRDVFADVDSLPEQPALIVNHPSGNTAFSSYFTAAMLDKATGTSSHALWDENFDAIEVFNDSGLDSNREDSVAHWFALLNAGKTIGAVGSSDSHHLRTSPVGYPRTFLQLGYDDPQQVTQEDVRDAIKAGRSTIGAGMFLSVDGPGSSAPGDTVAGSSGAVDFTVTVRSPTWVTPDTLEVIVNGETVATEPLAPVGTGPGKTFVNQVTVNLPAGPRSWVVFHAKATGDLAPVHPGKEPFAVSNPIYFTP
ncbi:MAG: CehA/McbA family metallohydrolase [Myxococcales bacterium]|nr:CehA/McbA family metallohydrolase [Myxococcales bacterium]